MRTRLLALVLLLAAAATLVIAAPGSTESSYIYKRGDTTYMRGRLDDLEKVAGRQGEFVWTRLGGREYVITDATVLASVRAAFAELDAKKQPLRDIERRLEPHEREQGRVERRIDDLSDELDDEDLPESTRATLERQLEAAEDELRRIEDRMRGLEQELERMEQQLERVEETTEENFERIVDRAISEGKAKRVD